MSFAHRLRLTEGAVMAQAWAQACAQSAQTLDDDLPTLEQALGPEAAGWVWDYLATLTPDERAILKDDTNWRRYPPHPVSQRLLTAWHAYQQAPRMD